MKCEKCGGKIRITLRLTNNEFQGVEAVCVDCSTDYSTEVEYDNQRAGPFD